MVQRSNRCDQSLQLFDDAIENENFSAVGQGFPVPNLIAGPGLVLLKHPWTRTNDEQSAILSINFREWKTDYTFCLFSSCLDSRSFFYLAGERNRTLTQPYPKITPVYSPNMFPFTSSSMKPTKKNLKK